MQKQACNRGEKLRVGPVLILNCMRALYGQESKPGRPTAIVIYTSNTSASCKLQYICNFPCVLAESMILTYYYALKIVIVQKYKPTMI